MKKESIELMNAFGRRYPSYIAYILTRARMASLGIEFTTEEFIEAVGEEEAIAVVREMLSGGLGMLQETMKKIKEIEGSTEEEILSEKDKEISDEIISRLGLE